MAASGLVDEVDDALPGCACSSFHRPAQPGVMRASGATQVISVIIRPAPPVARLP
jgi:hypothetical protein